MKKKLAVVIGMLVGSTSALADPGFMLGIAYNFGGTVGLTFNVLSSNKEDRAVAAVGASYFPLSKTNQFGITLGGGYTFKNGAATVGWDVLNSTAQFGIGYVDTKDKSSAPPPPPPPPPVALG